MEKGKVNYNGGNQPVLSIHARTSPEAWQQSMLKLWDCGLDVPTSFDRPGDPLSKDATVLIQVDEPLGEPRIHKNYPSGFESLEHYRLEVTHGVHDHWMDRFDKTGQKWNYTYHERLRAYDNGNGEKIDQLENMIKIIEKKVKDGKDITNRRFQITTWIPNIDPFILDPPCLQRGHFRILPTDESKKTYMLNMNTDWRSRDGYKAWFMNVFAFTEQQRLIAKEISERTGLNIKVGRYCDKSDSLHIYGKDFHGNGGFAEFYKRAKKVPMDDLVFRSDDEIFRDSVVEGRHLLAAQLDYEKKTGNKGITDSKLSSENILNFPYPSEWDK